MQLYLAPMTEFATCSTRWMSATEAAWLAGFFDGEGSLSMYLGGRTRKNHCWVLSLGNTDTSALHRCIAYTGVGKPKENRRITNANTFGGCIVVKI